MATDLKSLKLLLWAKRRRLEPLEQQVQAETAQRDAAVAAHQAAMARHQDCVADETACAARIDALASSDAFNPQDVVTLGHVLDGLKDLVRQAEEGVRQAAAQVAQAQARLAAAKQALQRAEQQIEQLEERRRKRLVEIDQEAEDTQDEESEEAAVARKVGQRRAAAMAEAQA
ncbi:hypothetical protein [Mitsuaria sp. GD03876]|uniref:hypothetical protein n=1 Tax=Mitsuaria sp. GD03876 TaxID=2975399 RepID=UPI00244C7582|nr:hypothetical protein [Mitsuaria sp. GD03876]MDH0868405.1 hypothetical protein [Mitsuaria sp. GD03876]